MSTHKEKEQQVFKAFLQVYPSLADQIHNWSVQEEEGAFPDVIATLHNDNGPKIGFELGEWLDEEQIRYNKKTDQFSSELLGTIEQPQPENHTQHIQYLLLTPENDYMQFDDQDKEKFRKQLFALIQQTDQQWSNREHWHSPQGYHCKEFDRFPTLAKYLTEVWFVPLARDTIKRKQRLRGTPWIDVVGRGGSYSGESARKALQKIIRKKLARYGGPFRHQVNLLIHYGTEGFIYNTPFLDITTPDFEAVANFVSETMQFCFRGQPLPFEKVYLCNTLPHELEAYEVFPQLLRCI